MVGPYECTRMPWHSKGAWVCGTAGVAAPEAWRELPPCPPSATSGLCHMPLLGQGQARHSALSRELGAAEPSSLSACGLSRSRNKHPSPVGPGQRHRRTTPHRPHHSGQGVREQDHHLELQTDTWGTGLTPAQRPGLSGHGPRPSPQLCEEFSTILRLRGRESSLSPTQVSVGTLLRVRTAEGSPGQAGTGPNMARARKKPNKAAWSPTLPSMPPRKGCQVTLGPQSA